MRNAVLRQAVDGRTVEDGEFEKRLHDLAQTVDTMRGQLLDLMPSAPEDAAEWIRVMSGTGVLDNLGFLMILSAKNAGWVNAISGQILQALGRQSPDASNVIGDVLAGQVRAEMSCDCKQCDPCTMRAKMGNERAEERIRDALRPTGAIRLVGPNGRPVH